MSNTIEVLFQSLWPDSISSTGLFSLGGMACGQGWGGNWLVRKGGGGGRSRDGDPRRADGGGWGGGVQRYPNIRCADHFEARIMGDLFFWKKIFQAASRRNG